MGFSQRHRISKSLRRKLAYLFARLVDDLRFRPWKAREVVRGILSDADYRAELERLDMPRLKALVDRSKRDAFGALGHNIN